jgi:hypothetical protein
MVETTRRKNGTFHQTKVRVDGGKVLGDDLWVTQRVVTIFVAPNVNSDVITKVIDRYILA